MANLIFIARWFYDAWDVFTERLVREAASPMGAVAPSFGLERECLKFSRAGP